MNAAAGLLLYAVVVLVAGPALLLQLTANGVAPRLAITAWLTAIASVLGSFTAAVCVMIVEAAGHWGRPDELLTSCLERLTAILLGHGGQIPQAITSVAVAAALGILVWTSVRIARSLLRARDRTFAHAEAVRLVGRSTTDNIVVVDTKEAAAYCVAGRPPAIVITTAVLTALDSRQLAAVLAHERAHLDGRHAYIVASLRSLATILPYFALFTEGAARITALLEMCADDVAARRHGRRTLLSGLLVLSRAHPSHALGAASIAVLTRAQRLTDDHDALRCLPTYLALVTTACALTAAPLSVGVLACAGMLPCAA
ncbi:M56 family metallopeptidase [Mycolicibacterium llatzerense]|uniref:Peptidase M48 n=1 Tax=Mycolicibacterium llatzerense TaxID=280871 RepID=A0A0D1LEY5_9MYCO|nr:M56 family metallopeptidase [Mycolicibacterium llatzerense]KIU14496.1 peptidase M48 [Mycolicibacterium llatzerense]